MGIGILTSNAVGTYTATGLVQFFAGDTLTLVLTNPSTVTDQIEGTWGLQ